MKIVRVDNYARETVSDSLIAEGITNQNYAKAMLKACFEMTANDDTYYYRIVEDDYKLYTFTV